MAAQPPSVMHACAFSYKSMMGVEIIENEDDMKQVEKGSAIFSFSSLSQRMTESKHGDHTEQSHILIHQLCHNIYLYEVHNVQYSDFQQCQQKLNISSFVKITV